MDADVDRARVQRRLDLLRKQPLAAHFRERGLLQPVAARLDHIHDDLGLVHAVRYGNHIAHKVRLRQR